MRESKCDVAPAAAAGCSVPLPGEAGVAGQADEAVLAMRSCSTAY